MGGGPMMIIIIIIKIIIKIILNHNNQTGDILTIVYLTLLFLHVWPAGTEFEKSLKLFFSLNIMKLYEPPHGKTSNLHGRKQRRRSASQ